jgi:hypothetical protein
LDLQAFLHQGLHLPLDHHPSLGLQAFHLHPLERVVVQALERVLEQEQVVLLSLKKLL